MFGDKEDLGGFGAENLLEISKMLAKKCPWCLEW